MMLGGGWFWAFLLVVLNIQVLLPEKYVVSVLLLTHSVEWNIQEANS
jgi:hypothetical protein